MALINAGNVIMSMLSYRLVHIGGRFGGGKTSLAYMLAKQYLEQGYRLVSNNYCVWADDMRDVKLDENGHLRCVVVLDEGGQYITASKQVQMMMSYAAKMDIILVIPSYFEPTRASRVVFVQPLWNLRAAGIPYIQYKWSINCGSYKDSGKFGWWRPSEVFGIYSRQDPGDRAEEIVTWLIDKAEEFRERFGRTNNKISEMEITETDRLSDVADAFKAAADEIIVSIPKRNNRR